MSINVSHETLVKQEDFRNFLRIHTMFLKSLISQGRFGEAYHYFDLYSEAGLLEYNGLPLEGSPLTFARRVRQLNMRSMAYQFEKHPKKAQVLQENLDQFHEKPGVHRQVVVPGDHRDTIEGILKAYRQLRYNEKRYPGLIYCDPYGTDLSIDVVNKVLSVPCFQSLDVLLSFPVNSLKRATKCSTTKINKTLIADYLLKIDKPFEQWIIREPLGKAQWSLMLNSRWAFCGATSEGYYSVSTERGGVLIDRLDLTVSEFHDKYEMSFEKYYKRSGWEIYTPKPPKFNTCPESFGTSW